jgi:hypothetical protein
MFAKESMQSELDHSMLYDCSIEHYKDLLSQEYVWPYTMDKGQAPSAYIRDPTFTSAPGLWEMPVYEIMTDTNWQAVTGLDYNMWVSKSMAKDQFEYCLKITLDNRLKNNRAPFLIGMHSDYYSQWNDVANGAAKETWQNRRASVQDFITYALALNKDIRVVSFKDVLTWVRHPVALGSAVPLAVRENEFQRRGLRARLCGRFVRLTMPQSGICHPALYDCNGRRILDFGEQHLSSGENMLQLKQGLVPGLYTLRIDNGTNSLAVENGLQK